MSETQAEPFPYNNPQTEPGAPLSVAVAKHQNNPQYSYPYLAPTGS
jgi:hypothetical protein